MSQQQGDIQERIAAARREAESLRDKIRAKKESTADTSRKFISLALNKTTLDLIVFVAHYQSVLWLQRSILCRVSSCVLAARSKAIWPKFTQCIGLLTGDILSRRLRMAN